MNAAAQVVIQLMRTAASRTAPHGLSDGTAASVRRPDAPLTREPHHRGGIPRRRPGREGPEAVDSVC